MSFSSCFMCTTACGTVRLSLAVTVVTVRVFGALPDCIHRDTDTPRVGVRGARTGRFVHECVFGLRSRSSLGPNSTRPAQIWPYTCVLDPNYSEPSRAGRASVCNRAVECRFRPRYAPAGSARERVPCGPCTCGEWRAAGCTLYTRHYIHTHANDRVHAKRGPLRRWVITSGLMRGECVLLGLRSRSSFGPNSTRPAQIWPYACVPDPNCSEPSRGGRASVCNRAVECAICGLAILSDFALGRQNRDFSKFGDIEPLPNSSFS